MLSLSISIDVPDLKQGLRFYEQAFGFAKLAEPVPGVAVLKTGGVTLCLLEKKAGSKPSPHTGEVRQIGRAHV